MRARFWRKKNARLVNRLNTVIETSERVRKSLNPMPSRVTIDTSYLAPDEDVELAELSAADFSGEPVPGSELAPDVHDAVEPSPTSPQTEEELAEAVEAERRTAARRVADAQRERAARRAAEAQRETLERIEAERAAEARRIAEYQREQASLREAAAETERQARIEVETRAREEAARKAAEAERELAALREAAAETERQARTETETRVREEAARKAAEAERAVEARRATEAERETAAETERQARIEVETRAREEAARKAAEAERAVEARRAVEAERELAALREVINAAPSGDTVKDDKPGASQDGAGERPASTGSDGPIAATSAAPLKARLVKSKLPAQQRPHVKDGRIDPAGTAELSRLPGEAPSSVPLNCKAGHTATDASADQRRARRVPSQMPASLWRDGMGQALSCTLRDKSSSGARLEFRPDRVSDGITEIVVGDQLTLTLTAAQERTLVDCVVVWISGNRCGVRFAGQFRTQPVAPRKSLRALAAEKAQASKAQPRSSGGWLSKGSHAG